MPNIDLVRDALSKILGARYSIGDDPPIRQQFFRQPRKTTVLESQSLIAGLEVDLEKRPEYEQRHDWKAKDLFRDLDDKVAERGVEALAWYVSFHNTKPEWGIYLPLKSVHYLADRLYRGSRVSKAVRVQIALRVLLDHELFHYAADLAQTQIELLTHKPCRAWLDRRFKPGQYLEVEESLANAYMLRQACRRLTPTKVNPIRANILEQPAGYCDALRYADSEAQYRLGLEEVIKSYTGIPLLALNASLPVSLIEWSFFFGKETSIDGRGCPIQLLHDDFMFGLPPLVPRYINAIHEIRETKRFRKKLNRLHVRYQDSWHKKKRELAARVPSSPEFEKFRDVYSIRLAQGHRAHLRPIANYAYWEAVDIGTHTELGHD